jgi:tyrosyl-tRNA synthetase
MKISEDLHWRGLIKDRTFSDIGYLDKPQTFYLGIDPSADSLTVGNLAIIMLVKRLANSGWHPVLVMGGGTSLVGDPGGKTNERNLMSRETVVSNSAAISKQVRDLFKNQDFTMVDNYDWLSNLKYLDFIRDVGKHFSMTELMQRDFVKERMGEHGAGISYTEFSYSLVQGYDFWHLFKNNHVVMQVGGSDQWGNLLSGVSLIRKKESIDVHAMSMPLIINKTTGVKFGKSENGAVWLDPSKTNPADFYQFWINSDDTGIEEYLKVYTELDKPAIDEIMNAQYRHPQDRIAQNHLATEVTRLVHGESAVSNAKKAAVALRSSASDADSNIIKLSKDEACTNLSAVLTKVGLTQSNSDALRLIKSGGIYVNDKQFHEYSLGLSDFQNNRIKLRRGKTLKNTVIIEVDG